MGFMYLLLLHSMRKENKSILLISQDDDDDGIRTGWSSKGGLEGSPKTKNTSG